MLTPPPYADAADRLAALYALAVRAYGEHARNPAVRGPEGTHFAYWTAAYEAGAALKENNPAFAVTLLPRTGTVTVEGPGLPLVPAGVRFAVDEARPGSLTVTVDVAGAVTLTVQPPLGGQPFTPAVTLSATRATTTFDAPADGLYALAISVGSAVLARVLVPVLRAEQRRLRENSRDLAFQFLGRLPRPGGPFKARLARLIAAEAAAQTGQPELFARLTASAAAVPAASSPVNIYPHG